MRARLAPWVVAFALSSTGFAYTRTGGRLFASHDSLAVTLAAPFDDLFARAREDHEYSVTGTLTYVDEAIGREVRIENVSVFLRGHTSIKEDECSFPKLKLKFPAGAAPPGSLFEGLKTVKIGTHCGDRPDDALTPKYGRLANEKGPVREAVVYRILAALEVPTLEARPAKITYVGVGASGKRESDGASSALVRRAEFIEDDSDAMARYGARRQLTPEEFGSAQSRFSRADAARLAFAEALIGNFDWCVRFYPGDNYRCDDRHPLWNVLALDRGGSAMPLMYDFDVSGMVVGRHLWFDEIFGHQFAPEASEAEIEVESQLQRTRSLFPRDELDRTRMEFVRHKQAAYEALDASELDGNGRKNIHAYLNAFYDIVEHDDRFDIPVVVDPNARIFQDAAATRPACGSGTIPVGTPVAALERRGRWTRAAVLDALWHWSPPHKCEAVHDGSVWIRSDAVSAEYP